MSAESPAKLMVYAKYGAEAVFTELAVLLMLQTVLPSLLVEIPEPP
tara:strand:- start:63 stop:200 length:138 start_codon:yes stop_codon:yes gene_type:complete